MTEAMPFLQKTILLSYDPRPFVVGFVFVSAPLSGAGLYLNYALGGGLYLNYAHLQIHLLHASFPDKGEHALANGVAALAIFRLMW